MGVYVVCQSVDTLTRNILLCGFGLGDLGCFCFRVVRLRGVEGVVLMALVVGRTYHN